MTLKKQLLALAVIIVATTLAAMAATNPQRKRMRMPRRDWTTSCEAVLKAKAEGVTAFPGAEGFGRYTTGGRGGKVYHVTTLEDTGREGSFRYACEQEGARTIVFDVSGTIFLKNHLRILNGNLTIAGQTAPGDGICIADYPLDVMAENVILRYLHIRLGNRNVSRHNGDGLGISDGRDIMVDHCSVSWSIDECLSVCGNTNSTVQWCIVSQPLNDAGHKKGAHGYGGNWGGSGSTFHHNLLAHATSRTPRLGPKPNTQCDERMDMRNNVIYNWGGNGCYGGEGMKVNIVNNYYKPGPATLTTGLANQKRITAVNIRTSKYTRHDSPRPNGWDKMWHVWGKYYVSGNVNSLHADVERDNWTFGMYNQIDSLGNDGTYTAATKDTIRVTNPLPYADVTTHSAAEAYALVLENAGCIMKKGNIWSRDTYDETIISDTREGKATHTGTNCLPGMINSHDDAGGWPTLASTTPLPDTDGDGIPDTVEQQWHLNPTDPTDGNALHTDGRTQLERYLNAIVEEITNRQTKIAQK